MFSHTQLRVSSTGSFLGRTRTRFYVTNHLTLKCILTPMQYEASTFSVCIAKKHLFIWCFFSHNLMLEKCSQVDDDNVAKKSKSWKMQYKVQLKSAFGHPINIVNVHGVSDATLRRLPVLLRLYECVCRSVCLNGRFMMPFWWIYWHTQRRTVSIWWAH